MADHVFRQSDLERSAWLILANHQAKERLNLPMLKQPSMTPEGYWHRNKLRVWLITMEVAARAAARLWGPLNAHHSVLAFTRSRCSLSQLAQICMIISLPISIVCGLTGFGCLLPSSGMGSPICSGMWPHQQRPSREQRSV